VLGHPVEEDAMAGSEYVLRAIGEVKSPIKDPVDEGWGTVESQIVLEPIPGPWTVKVTYAGDDTYSPSTLTRVFQKRN